jgi:hypothetical protein
LSHGLAVFQACGYDAFAKIYGCWFHGHYYTS